jgi:crotonobetainyl-CoA:carnitine CoA-transferase CaiB-like acyl-CoA transferase
MSASFAAMNRNKRGIAVDLQRPEGVRLAFELVRRGDVLVESFLPGVTERLGLGYDWGPIGLDAATITHRRATLTRGGLR